MTAAVRKDGYLKFTMCDFMTACNVRNLQLTRNELDISVLPRKLPCGTKRAQYKKVMLGYANITERLTYCSTAIKTILAPHGCQQHSRQRTNR